MGWTESIDAMLLSKSAGSVKRAGRLALLVVVLIDAASGRVVHDARHAGCDGPLTMVLGENWVVYEYWSPALLQHQVTVSELFTNATHTGAAADDVLSSE